MAGRTVTVKLENYYGHPSNNRSKEEVLKVIAEQLPKAIANATGEGAEGPVWFKHFEVTSITVE